MSKNQVGIDFMERLSGGNHELFHSNLLAFLAEHEPEFFKELFGCKNYDKAKVGREDNNLDICLYDKNTKKYDKDSEKIVLIIENKMKSRPSKEQLQRYVKKNKENFSPDCKLILLTLLKPTWKFDKSDKIWEVVTYDDLTKRINNLLSKGTLKSRNYLSDFLIDYVKYIRKVSSMVKEIKKFIDKNNPTIATVQNLIENKKFNWAKYFSKKTLSHACLEYFSDKWGDNNIEINLINNNRGEFGFEALIQTYLKFPIDDENNSDKISEVQYFINLQGPKICRGFRIYTPDSILYKGINRGILKNVITERGYFLQRIWNDVLTSDTGTKIRDALMGFGIDLNEYGTAQNFNSYIFEDYAMPYLTSQDVTPETELKSVISRMEKEILKVYNICEESKIIQSNLNQITTKFVQ